MNKFVNVVNGDVTINTFRDANASATTLSDLIATANDDTNLCASIDADDVATLCGNDWFQSNATDFCCTLEIEGMAIPTYLEFTVSFDGRRKTKGDVGMDRLEAAAKDLLDDGDEHGFKIVTTSGHRMTADEVRIKQVFHLPAFGNSVFRSDAYTKLEEFSQNLADSGVLDQ